MGCAVSVASLVLAGRLASVVLAGIFSFGVKQLFDAFTAWVSAGDVWLLDQIGRVLQASTSVDLGANWFLANYRTMMTIAAVVVVPVLLCSVIQAVVQQRLDVLLRSTLVHLPLALLLTGVSVQLVALGLSITDSLCQTVTAGTGASVQHSLRAVAGVAAAAAANPAVPGFANVLVDGLMALGAVCLWLELLVRAAAVYVAVLFLPLALVALVWPATAHWCRRLVDVIVALVLSKFVVVAILALSVSAIGSLSNGFGALLAGVAMLLLATFAPFVLLRLVPLAAEAVRLEGTRQRLTHVATAAPMTAASFALSQMGGAALAGEVPGTGRPQILDAPGGGGAATGGASRGGSGGGAAGTGPGGAAPGGGEPRGGASGGGASGGAPDGGRGVAGDGRGGSRGAGTESAGAGGSGAAGPDTAPTEGVPMWQGVPASDAAFAEAVGDGSTDTDTDAAGLSGGIGDFTEVAGVSSVFGAGAPWWGRPRGPDQPVADGAGVGLPGPARSGDSPGPVGGGPLPGGAPRDSASDLDDGEGTTGEAGA